MAIYYSVGDRIFHHKIDAVMQSAKDSLPVEWHFHKEIFKSIDWTQEPETSLDDFYRIRAQQIRDSYDYVVILCSGGADSTNVINTFLNNKIMPDEVIASAPMEGLRDYKFNSTDTSHTNTISETIYAQIPLMQEIASKYPSLKITLHDYFQDMLSYKPEEWLYTCEDWIHPSSAARYNFEKHKHLKDLAESGKRIAFVYGIDKPVIVKWKDNHLYSFLTDLTVNVPRPAFNQQYPNVDNVLFYWTPDLPLMMVKQAHVVAHWMFKNENARPLSYMYDHNRMVNETFEEQRARHSKYERSIVPAIYPSTCRKVFQAEKPESLFLGEHDNWFYKHHSSVKALDMMVSDVRNFFKKIDSQHINRGNNGFKFLINQYRIGPIEKFDPRSREISIQDLTSLPSI